jgi:hypothetical protein
LLGDDFLNWVQLVTGIMIPLISLFVGSAITYKSQTLQLRYQRSMAFKEERYMNLLSLLQGFVGNTTSVETKRKFFDEYYRSWVYASDNVIKAIEKMLYRVIEDDGNNNIPPGQGRKLIGEIVVSMREDLAIKSDLDYSHFQYIDVNDHS